MGLHRAVTLTDRDYDLLQELSDGPKPLAHLFWTFFASDEDRKPGKRPDYAKLHRRMDELAEYGFVTVVGEPNRPKTGHLTEAGRAQLAVRALTVGADAGTLLPPEKWEAITGVTVYDSDGWRADGKSWDEPVSRDEFLRRASVSTVLADVNEADDHGRSAV